MTSFDYFPSKIARGEQFCNRFEEQKILKHHIELARHTVLIAPRRYGKSSLVYKIADTQQIPFTVIDLFLAHDDKTITKRILAGIEDLVSQIMPNTSKTLSIIQQFFAQFKIGLTAGGFSLNAVQEELFTDPVDQIYDALSALAKLAEDKHHKILLFMDEFQVIANSEKSKAVQGAIRNVAQNTNAIVFIFSGSTRHLLLELFDDKSKPLFKLCDKLFIDRISSEHYLPFIQQAAEKRWEKPLETAIILRILSLTELHPFYVNMLCHQLWQNDTTPNLGEVLNAWQICFEQEKRRVVSELEKLTPNQHILLKSIALQAPLEPTGHYFVSRSGLPLSSVRQGLHALLEKDMIHQVKHDCPNLDLFKPGQYRVLDPLIAFSLKKYS